MTMSIPNCTSAIDSPLLLNKSEIAHDDRRRSGREISCCLLLSILGAVRLLVAVSWVSCLFTLLFDEEVDDKFKVDDRWPDKLLSGYIVRLSQHGRFQSQRDFACCFIFQERWRWWSCKRGECILSLTGWDIPFVYGLNLRPLSLNKVFSDGTYYTRLQSRWKKRCNANLFSEYLKF